MLTALKTELLTSIVIVDRQQSTTMKSFIKPTCGKFVTKSTIPV